jgi:hypothetical protein
MHAGGQGLRVRSRAALVTALLALAAPVPLRAADVAPPAADPTPIAAMVHLSGGPWPGFPAPAAEVRAAAFEALAALSGARGRLLADRERTEDLVRRHRIRTGSLLTSGFLTDLRAETRAGTLLAVGVLAQDGRLSVSVRAIDTSDGRLTALGLAESLPTADTWRAALTEALRQAYPELAGTAAGGQPLLVLPARTVGLDAQVSRTATSCVLAEALASGGWTVLDPALVTGAATAAGRDLDRLDRDGRALLSERCGVTWAVVPEVVSFDLINEAGAGRAPVDEEAGFEARRIANLTLSLQLLDLRTGVVRATVSIMVTGDPRIGWFGRISQPTEVEQLRSAAGQLWARIQHILEEQNS